MKMYNDEQQLTNQLKYHFMGNFYPRHDIRMIDLCIEAIKTYNENLFEIALEGDLSSLDTMLDIPKDENNEPIGLSRGKPVISVGDLISTFRLEYWLDDINNEYEEE